VVDGIVIYIEKRGLLMENFDINIWDRVGYLTDYEQEGWTLTPHFIVVDESGNLSTGDMIDVIHFNLTKDEAEFLTLGMNDWEEGGDYCGDADFWLDFHNFFDVYKNIPDMIATYLHYVHDLLPITIDIHPDLCYNYTCQFHPRPSTMRTLEVIN
jgi:hypothetical protein